MILNLFLDIKDFLIEENTENTYIFEDSDINKYVELFKKMSLSNNNLVIIDTGRIDDIHRKLANKIITIKELNQEYFL